MEDIRLTVRFRSDGKYDAGRRIFQCTAGSFQFWRLGDAAGTIASMLSAGGITEKDVVRSLSTEQKACFEDLRLCLELCAENSSGDVLAVLTPSCSPIPEVFPVSAGGVLSRFVHFRKIHRGMVLEDPAGVYTISLFCRECWDFLWGEVLIPNGGISSVIAAWLEMMGCYEEMIPQKMDFWEPHDLYFHWRSRGTRNACGRPQPYRHSGCLDPLPVLKPVFGETVILDDPCSLPEKNFADVLLSRHSRRKLHGSIPFETFSAFLRLSAKVKQIREDCTGGISFRPSPSAGALHGLEIYPAVLSVDGIRPGLYRYDPGQHVLENISDVYMPILHQARQMAASSSPPAVCCVITARFARYQYKYSRIAYSVMLKDAGCLHQTMSLAAEYLGLGSVILGDVPPEPFVTAAGLEWSEESPVGAFSLGMADVAQDLRKGYE